MENQKKKTNDILKQGTILAAASILVRLIGMVYRIPLGNQLGEVGNGYYSIAYSIYSLALIISSYGLPLAVSKMVADKNTKKEYKNSYKIFKNSLLFSIIVGALVGGIIFFGADFFAGLMKSPGSVKPLKVLAPTIFCVAMLGVFRGFFQGQNTMVPTAVSQILEQIVNAVVSIVAAYYFMKAQSGDTEKAIYGATGSTLGTFSGAAIAFVFFIGVFFLNLPILKKKMKRDKHPMDDNMDIYRILFATIIPVILSQTVYQLSGIVDQFLFGNIMATKNMSEQVRTAMLGVYSAQYSVLVSVPLGISTAMGTSMIPSIVSSVTKNDFHEVRHKIKSVVKFNMLIAFPSAVGLAVLGRPIIAMLFPNLITYQGVASSILLYGSSAIVFYALSTVTSGVLQAINQMRLPVIHSAISLIIHVILVVLLLKFTNIGIYALVIGNVTFPLVVCILNWIAVGRHVNYNQEIKKTFLLPCCSSLIMGIICILVYKVFFMILNGMIGSYVSNLIATVLAVGIGVLVYFVALLLLKTMDEEELKDMPMGRTLYEIGHKFHII